MMKILFAFRNTGLILLSLMLTNFSIKAQPTAFAVTGTGSYCEGSGGLPVGLAGSEAGVTYTLSSDGTDQGTVPGTGSSISFGNQLAGTYTVSGANQDGTTVMTGSAVITENVLPSISGTLTVCVNNNTQLTGSGTSASSNPWISETPAVASVTSSGLVTGLSSGTSLITYNDNNGCSISATVTVNGLPAITGTLSVCEGSITQLTGSGTAAASNPWISANTSVATINSSGLVTGVSAGTSVITYTISNGCSTTATVTVSASPSEPGGSTTQTFCSGVSPTIDDLAITGTGIQWYSSATDESPLATTTALVNNIHYYASQTINGCESISRLDVTAVVSTSPAVPSGNATQTFCSGVSPTVEDLVATGTGIQWFSSSTGGSPLATTTALVNNIHYYASQTINECESISRLDVTVVVSTTPAVPAGNTTQTFCSGVSPTVEDLVATGTGIQWFSSSTGGSPLATTTALVNNIHYYASQSINGCESISRLDVTAVVSTSPAVPSGNATQTFCSGVSPTVASLIATGLNIRWYSSSTGGSPLSETTALIGGNHYYASQTVNGCESTTRLDVTAVVNATPSAPGGSTSQTFCSVNSPTVANLVATGTNIRWHTASTGGTQVTESTALANNTHYYASQTVNGCESTSRLDVTSSITTTPNVPNQQASIMTGSTFTITPAGAGVPAGTTYTWTEPTQIGGVTGGSSQPVPQTSISGILTIPTGSGSATYTVTPSNGSCTGAPFTAIVFVNSTCVLATVTSHPANTSMCVVSGTASLTIGVLGTNPVTYQWQYNNGGTWTNVINGTPSGASYTGITGATLGISGLTQAGSQQYRCQVSNCGVATSIASNPATLTVDPSPSAPTIGSVLHPTCSNSTGTITVSAPVGADFTYSIDGSNYTNTTGVFANVAAGIYSITARNASGCISPGTAVTVNAHPATPPAPTVTLVQPTCNTPTGSVTVTTPSGIGMTYSINNTTYTNTTGVFTAVSSGTYTVTARGSAGCTSAGTIVNIQAQPLTPTVTVTNPAAVCSPSTVDLTAPAVTSGSTSNLTYTYWTNGAATAAYATPTTASSGTYYIKGTTSAGCFDVTPVIVTVWQLPTANAGTGGNECDLNFQLNAISSVGTGTWTMTSGPGAASFSPNANTPNAIVTVSVYGTYTFRWTEVNGVCSSNNSITVNFFLLPVSNPGTGGNNCGLQFHLNGSMNVGIGVWTRVSGTGTVLFSPSDTSPNATVTVPGYGAYTFRWTVTNGTCTNSSTVSVTFVQAPAADAGNGGEECDDDFILNAVPGTNGLWSMINGPGNAVFSNPAQPDATVTVDETGTYEFEWTISNSSCESTDLITVIFRDLPDVSAGRDTIICEEGSAQLQATGEGSFIWEPSASLSASGIANPVASPDVATTYTVTLTDEFGCHNKDEVEVEVLNIPVANAGPDRVLLYEFNTSMDAMALESGTGTWSIISGSGNISNLNDENANITGLALGANIFQWTVDNGVCPAVIDYITLTVQDIIIPTLITPDHGDDYNEYFEIRGLETLGKTSLIVFDRRGLKVYEDNNYNNDWNGVDRNNMDLPEDTYFYVLKLQNGKSLSGYILIRR